MGANISTYNAFHLSFFSFYFILFYFIIFTATPVAYGSSQTRVRIGATAEGYATATATPHPNHTFDLCHSLKKNLESVASCVTPLNPIQFFLYFTMENYV